MRRIIHFFMGFLALSLFSAKIFAKHGVETIAPDCIITVINKETLREKTQRITLDNFPIVGTWKTNTIGIASTYVFVVSDADYNRLFGYCTSISDLLYRTPPLFHVIGIYLRMPTLYTSTLGQLQYTTLFGKPVNFVKDGYAVLEQSYANSIARLLKDIE